MGEVNGLTVLQEFKQLSPDTSVVLLTAFGLLDGARSKEIINSALTTISRSRLKRKRLDWSSNEVST